MTADGNTNNFQGLASFLNIWFVLMIFFPPKKIQYKVLHLEVFLILSILWMGHKK